MDRTKTFSTLTLVLLLSGCGRRADEFLVASQNLTEQIILREIIVHYLEHRARHARYASAQSRGDADRPPGLARRRNRSLTGIHRHRHRRRSEAAAS